MDDVGVVKAAEHVDDGVALADVGQELVAQSFALAGALHQSGNVHNVTDGGHNASGVYQLGQFGQTLVGNAHLAHLGVDGAEGEIGSLRLCAAQTVKKGGLAYVGQSYDSSFQCHIYSLFLLS